MSKDMMTLQDLADNIRSILKEQNGVALTFASAYRIILNQIIMVQNHPTTTPEQAIKTYMFAADQLMVFADQLCAAAEKLPGAKEYFEQRKAEQKVDA
jgi:hypothetical protein